jgi:hypothetical protein
MKFLKTQNTSRFLLKDNAFKANPYGRYVMDGVGGLRLPKGTTAERPQLSGVEMPNGANGMMRYNTTTNNLECFIAGYWEVVAAPSASAILKETYGPGDYVEQYFGPLPLAYEPEFLPSGGGSLDNIIVLVENVWQISTTNYTLVQNPAGTSSPTGYLAGAAYSSVDGRTNPAKSTWWLRFNPEPPPLGKNVTVYYGYAN